MAFCIVDDVDRISGNFLPSGFCVFLDLSIWYPSTDWKRFSIAKLSASQNCLQKILLTVEFLQEVLCVL
jgi:hypothetical protein